MSSEKISISAETPDGTTHAWETDAGYVITVTRAEWRIVNQPIDQYGQDNGKDDVLAIFPSYEAAKAKLSNFAEEDAYVKGRWHAKSGEPHHEVKIKFVSAEIGRISPEREQSPEGLGLD